MYALVTFDLSCSLNSGPRPATLETVWILSLAGACWVTLTLLVTPHPVTGCFLNFSPGDHQCCHLLSVFERIGNSGPLGLELSGGQSDLEVRLECRIW